MANQYGTDYICRVYSIHTNGHVEDFKRANVLVRVNEFEDEGTAENWIINEGERQVDYTVLRIIRNK
jgi:hypothetical protein